MIERESELVGLEYAIGLVETYRAGVGGSTRPHADVRADTASEIAGCLRSALEGWRKTLTLQSAPRCEAKDEAWPDTPPCQCAKGHPGPHLSNEGGRHFSWPSTPT